jgi:hypothetical protein
MPSRFIPIQPGTDASQQVAIINKNFGELDNESVTKLYNGADGIPRIHINGATGVIKTAAAGVDVTTATNAQLTFNSAQNVLKVVLSSTATIPSYTIGATGSTKSSVTVTHGLGMLPAVIAYGTVSGDPNYWLWAGSYWDSYSAGGAGITPMLVHNYNIEITTTTVKFEIDSIAGLGAPTAGNSYAIKYYLLQETAN